MESIYSIVISDMTDNQGQEKIGNIEESSIREVVENDVSSSVPSSHLDPRMAESDIRERLKKQSRRPIHRGAMTYRLREHGNPYFFLSLKHSLLILKKNCSLCYIAFQGSELF